MASIIAPSDDWVQFFVDTGWGIIVLTAGISTRIYQTNCWDTVLQRFGLSAMAGEGGFYQCLGVGVIALVTDTIVVSKAGHGAREFANKLGDKKGSIPKDELKVKLNSVLNPYEVEALTDQDDIAYIEQLAVKESVFAKSSDPEKAMKAFEMCHEAECTKQDELDINSLDWMAICYAPNMVD